MVKNLHPFKDIDGDGVGDLEDLCSLNASQNCCPTYFIPAMDKKMQAELKAEANIECGQTGLD